MYMLNSMLANMIKYILSLILVCTANNTKAHLLSNMKARLMDSLFPNIPERLLASTWVHTWGNTKANLKEHSVKYTKVYLKDPLIQPIQEFTQDSIVNNMRAHLANNGLEHTLNNLKARSTDSIQGITPA